MKFRVTMKDPDTLHDAIQEAIERELANHVEQFTGTEYLLDADERDAIQERREEKTRELCAKWFRYSEYLTVEIDTDAKTCVVVEERP